MTQLGQQHDSNSIIAPPGSKRMQTDGRQATTQRSSSPGVPTRTLSLRRVPEATDMAAEFQNQIINIGATSSTLTFPSHNMPSPNSAGRPTGSIGQKLAKMTVATVPSGNVTDGKAGNLHATTALEVRADLVSKQQRLVSQRPVSPAMSEGSTASGNGSVGGGISGKGFEKVLQMFPEVLLENPKPPRDFVCSLDHAGIRWYGRIFIGSSCMCFSGTGISLSSGTKRNTSNGNNAAGPQGSNIGVFAWRTALNNNSLMSLASSQGPGHPVFGSLPRLTKVAAVLSAQIPNTPLSTTEFDSSAGGSKKPWRRTAIRIQFRDITRVSKELTMGFWPNVITVGTTHRQYIFTNFLRRDRAHRCLSEAWQKVKDQIAAETLRPKSPPISYASRPAAAAGPWVTQSGRRRKQLRAHNLSDSTAISSATSTAAIAQCESEMTICEGPTELSPSLSPDCAKTTSQSNQDSTPVLEAKSILKMEPSQ
ncbi:hypothetical protein LPJ66_005079 [Kickxella alabastrina]|uniref:Uncharacterized protein n=1 Tax=Kickxella alabastrina TaxID=61397 RepID=A0ACC1IN18_9FUNG|nr:hypothetical protein LPJ66_005079 [Kickxella alabastrina]